MSDGSFRGGLFESAFGLLERGGVQVAAYHRAAGAREPGHREHVPAGSCGAVQIRAPLAYREKGEGLFEQNGFVNDLISRRQGGP